MACVCFLTSTSRPLFLKLLMRWFSKPAFSAMAEGSLREILCETSAAAPVLRLWLLLRREGGDRGRYRRRGEEPRPTGCEYYGRYSSPNPHTDASNARYAHRPRPKTQAERCFGSGRFRFVEEPPVIRVSGPRWLLLTASTLDITASPPPPQLDTGMWN